MVSSYPAAFQHAGFSNRVNTVASAMLRWPQGFVLNWPVGFHCQARFDDIFEPWGEFMVRHSNAGIHGYNESTRTLQSHPYLEGAHHPDSIREVYGRIVRHVRVAPAVTPTPNSLCIHYRSRGIPGFAPSADVAAGALDLVARRAPDRILICSDHQGAADSIQRLLEFKGLPSQIVGDTIAHDFERAADKVLEFVKKWLVVTLSPRVISNAVNSTIPDAARAIGQEVWSYGHLAVRAECGLYRSLDLKKYWKPSELLHALGSH